MEKEKLFANAACLNWHFSSTMDMQLAELNSEQLPMLMNLHLENSMNQTAEFESAYSSIASSPQALGTICTLSSPPKLNLAMVEQQARGSHPISVKTLVPFPTDPGFAERAAKNSCFGNQSCFGGLELPYISEVENGKLPRVSSSHSLKRHGSLVGGAENNREESSVSEQITNEASGRKRKAGRAKGNAKVGTRTKKILSFFVELGLT